MSYNQMCKTTDKISYIIKRIKIVIRSRGVYIMMIIILKTTKLKTSTLLHIEQLGDVTVLRVARSHSPWQLD